MYIQVKDLPQTLQRALSGAGYHKADIDVSAAATYTMNASGSEAGRRAFIIALDLASGKSERRDGSWGGPNMFNPNNRVDLDDTARPLPPNFAVIHGSFGGGPTHARVKVHPDTLNPLLPKVEALDEISAAVLDMYAGLNSGGRKRQVEDWLSNASREAEQLAKDHGKRSWNDPVVIRAKEVAQAECQRLLAEAEADLLGRGFISRNRAGAVSVTTAGRNARIRKHWGYRWYPGKVEEAPAEMPPGETLALPEKES